MPQPFWLRHIWLRHLDIDALRQIHDEKLVGATETSFTDTLNNFSYYLDAEAKGSENCYEEAWHGFDAISLGTPTVPSNTNGTAIMAATSAAMRTNADSEMHPKNLEELIESIGSDGANDRMRDQAQKSLTVLYERMLSTPYYKTNKMPLPDGGFVLATFFGRIAADVPPERARTMSNEFHVVIPSASEYSRNGLPLPRPLSKRIWVEGKQRDLADEVRIEKLSVKGEGNYGVLVSLKNGLVLRLSTIDAFRKMVGGCEDLRTLVDTWNDCLALELHMTAGVIGALKLFRESIVAGHDADPVAKRTLKDAIFDLTYLIGAVDWEKNLRIPLRRAKNATSLDENDWHPIFEVMAKAHRSIKSGLFPFIHPDTHNGRYRQHFFAWRKPDPQPLTLPAVDKAVEELMRSAVYFANAPRLHIPFILSAKISTKDTLGAIARNHPDPRSTAAAVHAGWSACTPPAAANAMAAATMNLSRCIGV